MLNGSALFAQVERNYVELERIGREALAIARKLDDTEGICYSLHWLAKHAKLTADYDRARKYYAEALPLARQARYVDILTRLIRHMGALAVQTHDYEQAKCLFEEFLQISREFGNKNRTGLALRWLGQVAQKQGIYQEALRLYVESIKEVQDMEDKKQFFSTWLELASLSGVLGQFTRSAQLFGAVESLFPIIYKSTQSLLEDTYEECQKIKTACINNLGKEGFDVAYASGCAMTREQAIAYALEEIHE
jgi:tetratricopeptide (TPR) repeat protein